MKVGLQLAGMVYERVRRNPPQQALDYKVIPWTKVTKDRKRVYQAFVQETADLLGSLSKFTK